MLSRVYRYSVYYNTKDKEFDESLHNRVQLYYNTIQTGYDLDEDFSAQNLLFINSDAIKYLKDYTCMLERTVNNGACVRYSLWVFCALSITTLVTTLAIME